MPSLKKIANSVSSGTSPFDNGLEKLKIIGYDKPDYSGSPFEFTTQFNPTEISQTISVQYAQEKAPGVEESKKLAAIPSTVLKLKLTLDGTGVSGSTGTTGKKGMMGLSADKFEVKDELEAFKKATYNYRGPAHDLPFVKIVWGKGLEFKGRLSNLAITHVMFKSNGTPLRTTLDATFDSSTDPKTFAKKSDKQSPDLTHIRTVKTGDTLPLMCENIYNDSSCYLKVAKYNNLVNFRSLQPGTEIIFPPLI
jgi:hypothetical protein